MSVVPDLFLTVVDPVAMRAWDRGYVDFHKTLSPWVIETSAMGHVRIRHVIVHTNLPPSPVILWIELGGKPKWLPLNFGYHDVMRTGLIGWPP